AWGNTRKGSLSMDNCQLATSTGITFSYADHAPKVDLRLTRSTFVGGVVALLEIHTVPDFFTAGSRPATKGYHVGVENNVFDTDCTLCASPGAGAGRDKPVPAGPFKTLATDLVGWRDRGNLYYPEAAFMTSRRPGGPFERLVGPDQVAEWRKIAGPEAGVRRG